MQRFFFFSFTKYTLQCYMVWVWLNLLIENLGYMGHTIKLQTDIRLHVGSTPLHPALFRSQQYKFLTCILEEQLILPNFYFFSILQLHRLLEKLIMSQLLLGREDFTYAPWITFSGALSKLRSFSELTLCSITYLSLYEQVIRDPFLLFCSGI